MSTAKTATKTLLIGMVLGGLCLEYYQNASQPIVVLNTALAEYEEPAPREVRIKIDRSDWDTQRIQQEILKELPVIFLEIARCESTTRQYYAGTDDFVRGMVDEDDTGLFQVNKRYHSERSKSLGMDIEDTLGNILFTRYLYERDGLSPWNASKACWG